MDCTLACASLAFSGQGAVSLDFQSLVQVAQLQVAGRFYEAEKLFRFFVNPRFVHDTGQEIKILLRVRWGRREFSEVIDSGKEDMTLEFYSTGDSG